MTIEIENKYGDCLMCQLERGGKAYARQDYDLDYCNKHKTASNKHRKRRNDVLRHVDDMIDLDEEPMLRYDEQAEIDRIFD